MRNEVIHRKCHLTPSRPSLRKQSQSNFIVIVFMFFSIPICHSTVLTALHRTKNQSTLRLSRSHDRRWLSAVVSFCENHLQLTSSKFVDGISFESFSPFHREMSVESRRKLDCRRCESRPNNRMESRANNDRVKD